MLLDALITQPDKFLDNRLSIITFNYDRSLEHFLYLTLKSRYGWDSHQVADKVCSIPLLHVHGCLGLLPWQNETKGRKYRKSDTTEDIQQAAAGIKVIHERKLDDSPEFDKAPAMLAGAERIYFLGFGYHRENMRRLDPPLHKEPTVYDASKDQSGRIIWGTRYNLSNVEVNVLQNRRYRGLRFHDNGYPKENISVFLKNDYDFLMDTAL